MKIDVKEWRTIGKAPHYEIHLDQLDRDEAQAVIDALNTSTALLADEEKLLAAVAGTALEVRT